MINSFGQHLLRRFEVIAEEMADPPSLLAAE
jgi:hypothetical protein